MAVAPKRASKRGRNAQRRPAPGFMDDVLAMAGSLADSRNDHAAAQLETLAASLRQFGESVPSLPFIGSYAGAAAEGLDDLSGYVQDNDLAGMIADARELARRYPLAAFGSSVVAGLVITQFLQARGSSVLEARWASHRAPAEDGDAA